MDLNQTNDPSDLLIKYLKQHKWGYLASTLSILVAEIITVQSPKLIGSFTNALNFGHLTSTALNQYSLELVLVAVGYATFFGIGQYRTGRMGRNFEYLLRQRLFHHWEYLPTSYFRKRSIGDMLNHALTDVQAVREGMSMGLNQITNAVFLLTTTLLMMLHTISPTLTLVSILPILLIPLFVVWFGPRVRVASRLVQEALSDMTDMTEESLSAIRLIKATANETIQANRFAQRVDTIVDRQINMIKRSATFQSLIPLMGSLSFLIALIYGGSMTIHHHMPLGSFVAFTLYIGMVIVPLQQIGNVINSWQRAAASLLRLGVLLGESSTITDPRIPVKVSHLQGNIELNLPAFSYPDANSPTLRDISFSLRQGQTLGIIGRTGSGKTTLVNLLLRIFDPAAGTVLIDGHDVRQYLLADLRKSIAYVPQDGFLFSTTMKENIGFSKENVTAAEVDQAAKLACIYEDIQGFSAKFDTMIGERGVALSGGQKQRTAIARALLKDAPILILDDCLSAVDMNTERAILRNLDEVRANRTTIIVAHRLSAVRNADLIIVLEDGQIAERGTHESLLAQTGIYSTIYALQQEGTEVENE